MLHRASTAVAASSLAQVVNISSMLCAISVKLRNYLQPLIATN